MGFNEKYEAYRRVKGVLHVINLLSGEKPDWPSCEGCGKHILLKEKVFTYSDETAVASTSAKHATQTEKTRRLTSPTIPRKQIMIMAIAKAFIAEWDNMP